MRALFTAWAEVFHAQRRARGMTVGMALAEGALGIAGIVLAGVAATLLSALPS